MTEKETSCESSAELLIELNKLYRKGQTVALAEVLNLAPSLCSKLNLRRWLWDLKEEGWLKLKSSGTFKRFQIGPSRTNYSSIELTILKGEDWFTSRARRILFLCYQEKPGSANLAQEVLAELPIRITRRGGETIGYLLSRPAGERLNFVPVASYDLKEIKQSQFYKLWREICARSGENSLVERKALSIAVRDEAGTDLWFVHPSVLMEELEEDTRSL